MKLLFIITLSFFTPILYCQTSAEIKDTTDNVVQILPRFYSKKCEKKNTSFEMKKRCGDRAMLEFIYKNLKYPQIARENGDQGTAIIGIVISQEGFLKNVNIEKEPSYEIGEEALKVIRIMEKRKMKWVPGTADGEKVDVKMSLPIKFSL